MYELVKVVKFTETERKEMAVEGRNGELVLTAVVSASLEKESFRGAVGTAAHREDACS